MEEMSKESWKVPIRKSFYQEEPVTNMPSNMGPFALEIGLALVTPNSLSNPAPRPVASIQQAFRHSPRILELMEKHTVSNPSAFQQAIWPAVQLGRDVIGIAPQGTDRTFAVLPPVFVHIEAQNSCKPNRVGPTVIVVTATKKSALDLESELEKFPRYMVEDW